MAVGIDPRDHFLDWASNRTMAVDPWVGQRIVVVDAEILRLDCIVVADRAGFPFLLVDFYSFDFGCSYCFRCCWNRVPWQTWRLVRDSAGE